MHRKSAGAAASSRHDVYMTDSSVRLKAAGKREASRPVRVRLLIAIPVVIVLLLAVMGGMLYQFVDLHFGDRFTNRPRIMEEFAADWLMVLLMFIGAGAAVGILLAYSITSVIRRIVETSVKVAGGDLSAKVPVKRQDEMGVLGSSFNTMIDSLNEFFNTRNRFIMDSFSGGLFTTDVNGTITTMNSAAEQVLGLSAGAVTGRAVREVLGANGFENLLSVVEEVLWKREPVIARIITINPPSRRIELSVNASVMRDKSEGVFGTVINFRDLAALQDFYEHMNRADRLATVGTFATGLAHEVRNPLGAIKGTAQLLAEDVKQIPRAVEYTQIIVKEVNRLDSLVREVQAFSQPTLRTQQLPTSINDVVRETVVLARNNLQNRPEIRVEEMYEDLPVTVAAADKIKQALLNILMNAFQAVVDDGIVRVRTEYLKQDPLPLRIIIFNTGSTILPAQMGKLFEPFYTTKESGTGLGLSIAYQIVSYHDGDIDVRSGEHEVEFTIKLPLHRMQQAASEV